MVLVMQSDSTSTLYDKPLSGAYVHQHIQLSAISLSTNQSPGDSNTVSDSTIKHSIQFADKGAKQPRTY